MAETLYRRTSKKGWTTVYRSVAQDTRLTLKARGLFLLMQSLPEDWTYTISGLAAKAGTGKDQVRAALRELAEVGYLVKEQAHDTGGKFARNVFILQDEAPPLSENPTTVGSSEAPLSGKPSTGKPTTDFPSTENPTLHNTDIQNQDINNPPISPQGDGARSRRKREPKEAPDWKPERFEAFWAYYRTHVRPEDRQAAIRAWDRLQPDDALIARIGRALQIQTQSQDWLNGVGKPYASTYLNNARWKDVEVPPAGTQPAPERRYGWQ